MEHRLSLRTPLTMNVAIYYRGLGLLQGRSLDVSRHGMFVAMGPMVLPLHSVVDVAFPIKTGKHSAPPQRTPAMVVRLANNGVGLMFAHEVCAGAIEPYEGNTQADSRLVVNASSR
ncbi:MAG: PilZ domain-containing protein [Gammaproteobacteria bacterium]|jgi:hypothetical protein